MNGYINLFESECDLIGEEMHPLAEGCRLTLTEPPYAGCQAVLCRSNGRWILRGENFTLASVQGVGAALKAAE